LKRAVAFLLTLCVSPAWAATPQDAWKAAIADQNNSYARKPHAMLKIQASVYLGEGESAALTGRKGVPASWRWGHDAGGVFIVSIRGGKLITTLDNKPVDAAQVMKGVAVDRDVDVAGQPTQVSAGVKGWRLFVYNQQAPAAKTFTGVSYYPYDPVWRVAARFTPDTKLPPRIFRTSRGTDKQFFHAGDARFTVQGKAVTLPFYTDANNGKAITTMSAFFTDGLTGKGAYGAGRYVDVTDFGKFPPVSVTIDFNQAYNPNCARSAHFTCPYAMDALPMAMQAGERDPHGAPH
jgi:uncharacterized protein (DUF1684 family)